MNVSLSLIGAVLAFAALIMALPWLAKKSSIDGSKAIRRKLKTMALGDERVIDRLLTLERRKHPELSEKQCLERILDAWQYDRGR